MSRIRSLHPGIYTDEAWASVSVIARWLGMGLCTEADDNGIFEWKPIQIKMRIFPADAVDIAALLSDLEQAGIVCRFEADGKKLGAIRNFCKYQRPRKPKAWFPINDAIKEFVSFSVSQKSEPDEFEQEPAPPKSEKSPQMEDGGCRREDGKEKKAIRAVGNPTRPERDELFERFWKAYPSRGDRANPKAPARKVFDALVRQNIDPEAIIAGLIHGSGYDRQKVGTEYIPQAVKWLRDRRWEDFAPTGEEPAPLPPGAIYLRREDPRWDDFAAPYRAAKGHDPPTDRNGGWMFRETTGEAT